MKKVIVIAVCLMLSLGVFAPKSYAGEGPIEAVCDGVAWWVDAACKGTCWFVKNAWNNTVWLYGATENTLETRKLNGPKWEEEQTGKKK